VQYKIKIKVSCELKNYFVTIEFLLRHLQYWPTCMINMTEWNRTNCTFCLISFSRAEKKCWWIKFMFRTKSNGHKWNLLFAKNFNFEIVSYHFISFVNKILLLITGIAVPYKTSVELERNVFVEQAKVFILIDFVACLQ